MAAVTPRMNGTPLEAAHWRINALREALREVAAVDAAGSPDAPRQIAEAALAVDDGNRSIEEARAAGG